MDEAGALSDKLKSLGVTTGTQQKKAQDASWVGFDISEVVKGKEFETAFGPTFVVEYDYPFEEIQGNGSQINGTSLEMIGQWSGYPELAGRPLEDRGQLARSRRGSSGRLRGHEGLTGAGGGAGIAWREDRHRALRQRPGSLRV